MRSRVRNVSLVHDGVVKAGGYELCQHGSAKTEQGTERRMTGKTLAQAAGTIDCGIEGKSSARLRLWITWKGGRGSPLTQLFPARSKDPEHPAV